ncbi:unnamed protein product [Dovyalis caffra]|uniref:Uncharacterized protein n=1 Tax=Dovyalis caffra TaxID=77055 RepID=A0AAV1S1Y5_9ROSI|nr:unnamed protein product [Dovyalis caffra]
MAFTSSSWHSFKVASEYIRALSFDRAALLLVSEIKYKDLNSSTFVRAPRGAKIKISNRSEPVVLDDHFVIGRRDT